MAHGVITRSARRSVVSAVVAIATLFVAVPSVTTVAAPNRTMDAVDAVKWTVDKATKTITVEVHLAFFTNARIPDGRGDTVSSRIAFIQAAILKAWDGLFFKCYTVRVKLVVRQVDNVDDVRDDEVPIELDAAIYPIGDEMVLKRAGGNGIRRSYVSASSDSDSEYRSEDPSSAVVPVTGPQAQHTTWHMFESGRAYAHEFGHILGLGDSYVEGTGGTRPGVVDDLMSNRNRVDETTITRMIRRAGIDDKELPCPMTWDLPDALFVPGLFTELHFHIHAWTCDYDPPSNAPEAKPQIIFTGDFTTSGSHSDPIFFPGLSGSGVEHFTTAYPVGDPALLLVLSTGLIVKQTVVYFRGKLLATHPVSLAVPAASLQLDTRSEFTLGAKECPE